MAYRSWEVKSREGEPTPYSSPWYVVEVNPCTGPEQFKAITAGAEKGYLAAEFGCMKLVDEWESTYRSWYA